ncbi:MAG: type II secretion system F family protein [Archaeoglobaceae archaeon]
MMTPERLKRYFRKKVEENPAKYSEISRALDSSRLRITLPELLASALFYALIAMVISWILCYLGLIYLNKLLKLEYFDFWKLQLVIATVFSILSFILVRYLVLLYPYYVSRIRRGKIDSALPHVTNMMLGMLRGNLSLIAAIKFIAENKALFGEISVEFEKIAVLAEIDSLENAMKFVAETTPSEKFRMFLENLIEIHRGSGDVVGYLKAKSDQFFSEKERSYMLLIESMQVLAEIYLAIFILAPLFLLIILVAFNVMRGGFLELYRIFIFTILPVGSIMILWIASSFFSESRKLGKFETKLETLSVSTSKRKPGFKFKKLKRFYNLIKNFLLYPVIEMPYAIELKHVIFYVFTPGMVFFLVFLGKMEFDYLVFSTSIAIGLPLIVFVEYRERLMRRAERELPGFLKQLASLNEAGMNVVEALKSVSESELSVVGREMKIVKRYMEWGEVVTEALLKLERRLRSAIFQRAISILVKAIEASPSIKDALYVAAIFSELELEVKERIRAAMSTYLIIIYLSFGVFLYTSYVLIKNMFSVLATVQTSLASFDLFALKSVFMETSLLVAIFSGLTGGIMSEGRIEAGLKHIFIMMVIAYVFFKFIV